jgi:hypothetical protein
MPLCFRGFQVNSPDRRLYYSTLRGVPGTLRCSSAQHSLLNAPRRIISTIGGMQCPLELMSQAIVQRKGTHVVESGNPSSLSRQLTCTLIESVDFRKSILHRFLVYAWAIRVLYLYL